MTVTAVHKDPASLSMTLTSEFAAGPERIWQLWEDPHQLERWWGPPSHPATFTTHELRPGGSVAYYMTGPDGQRYHGWWQVLEADPPRSLAVLDGFANEDGTPNADQPTTTMRVSIEAIGDGRTRMEIRSIFPSAEAMEQVLAMGAEEGMVQAVSQIDAILASERATEAHADH